MENDNLLPELKMQSTKLTRRAALSLTGAAIGSTCIPGIGLAGISQPASAKILEASFTKRQILPEQYPATRTLAYNGQTPGPVLHVKQGERFQTRLRNKFDEPTTIHWHGVRVPNAMDGVPLVTQAPVGPGQGFDYSFKPSDAGTYWYHPHFNSAQQLDRGLSGVLIVEEQRPYEVDRDIVWVLDDWRLGRDGQIVDDFENMHDRSHGGRFGNVPTVNGSFGPHEDVRLGERLRIRLVNVANARIFAPQFAGLESWLIAFDGQPVPPEPLAKEQLVLGPGMRADIVVDISGRRGDIVEIKDGPDPKNQIMLAAFAIRDTGPVSTKPKGAPIALPANELPEPHLSNADELSVIFVGGAMGGMRSAMLGGKEMPIQQLARNGALWATNGVTYASVEMLVAADRLFTLKRSKSYICHLENRTVFPPPIHLHGHVFKVIGRNGQSLANPRWQDTILMAPREKVDIAFVADNPGEWMLHCHVLEHVEAGMMAAIRVA
jgi:FtsP/CotA-like multicopper oxidase with cupredoxin domain